MKEIQFQGKAGIGKVMLVDDEDFEMMSKYKWYFSACKNKSFCYAKTYSLKDGKWISLFAHRLIMNAPKDMIVDHKNHNGLDNRKANLRVCTVRDNARNRLCVVNNKTGMKGVHRVFRKRTGMKYVSAITLGTFDTPEEAQNAYARAAKIIFGEYNCVSNLDEQPTETSRRS